MLARFRVMNLLGNDFAAVDIQDQVQVPEQSLHVGWTVADVPAVGLVGPSRGKAGRFRHLTGRLTPAPVTELAMLFQNPIEPGLGGDVDALIGQRRYDLRRWQTAELAQVADIKHCLFFLGRELMRL